MGLKIGEHIPSFSLPNQEGEMVQIETVDHKSGYRLIYFYPKNNTRVCTAQACGINDNFDAFRAFDCRIYGISSDSIQSHERFAARHQLNFNLLSDQTGKIRKLFDATSFFGLLPSRVTYLVDSQGKVLFSCDSMLNLEQHLNSVIQYLKTKHETIKNA